MQPCAQPELSQVTPGSTGQLAPSQPAQTLTTAVGVWPLAPAWYETGKGFASWTQRAVRLRSCSPAGTPQQRAG